MLAITSLSTGSKTRGRTAPTNSKPTTLSRNASNTSDASLKSTSEDVFTFDKPDSLDTPPPPFDLPDNGATPGSPDRAGKPRVPPFKGFSCGGEGLKSPVGAGGAKMGKKADGNQRFALRSAHIM